MRRAVLTILAWLMASQAYAAPNYEEFRLDGLFPAGGRQGETVVVELFGSGNCNLSGAKAIVVDGAPGIEVKEVKNLSQRQVQATFAIAADAAPGRRCVRVLSERSGLTNMAYFTVGRLPEVREKEPNSEPASAMTVALPVVVNGRVDPKADVDCFRFELKKGQRLAAAVLAHSLDSHGQGRDFGFVDARLELLDGAGRVVAEAGDTLGLDPQLEHVASSADGTYTVRISLEGYAGFPQAVYRLVLGSGPMVTSVFPAGGKRGANVPVELRGPGVAAGARQQISVAGDDFPLQQVLPDVPGALEVGLPFVRGDLAECVEVEPNADAPQATLLQLPMTANGRIDEPGDVDCYRVRLAAKQKVVVETTAQRFLRAPLDTVVRVLDSAGKKLADNDDGFALDYVSMHDYRPMDSRLVFTAPAEGDYVVEVSDQSGNSGPRAVYRLTLRPAAPDFELYLYPDGVPVWGPGSTACVLAKVVRLDGLDGDIALDVEGLPAGWTAGRAVSRGQASAPPQPPVLYQLLTITAPPAAKAGDHFPFRIVGRAQVEGRTVERQARPLTWYYTSDTGLFRITPLARVAVAQPQTPWLSTATTSFTAPPGGHIDIPLRVHSATPVDRIELNADMTTSGVATSLAAPQTVAVKDGAAILPLKLGEQLRAGNYGIVVSLRWRSDIRIGMPGPCTPLLHLQVTPPAAAK